MNAFTQQQNEAIEKAYSLLTEQFEGVLLSVLGSSHDGEEAVEYTKVLHYGGHTLALGLCRQAEDRLLNIPPKHNEP